MRRIEQRTTKSLKGLRWSLLKDRSNLNSEAAADLDSLIAKMTTVRTARAWLYKEQLREILERKQINVVRAMLEHWCTCVMRSKVEPMKEVAGLIGIIVNLNDYNVGTDRGGELNTFDDFDIDYNRYKYLMETRMSGALVRPKSAIVIMKTAAVNVLATPTEPGFVKTTGVVTIPTVTGVVYKNAAGTTISAGAMTAIAAGASVVINAVAASGFYFANNQEDSWTFKRNDA
jgi:hypothetical protein